MGFDFSTNFFGMYIPFISTLGKMALSDWLRFRREVRKDVCISAGGRLLNPFIPHCHIIKIIVMITL